MSRKIITQKELAIVNEKHAIAKEEILATILTETNSLKSLSGDKLTLEKSKEEIATDARIEALIQEAGTIPTEKADTYSDRLMKYIPTEIIALFIALDTIIRSSTQPPATINVINWIIFGFCIAAIILFLIRKDKVKSVLQISISVGAFVVWIFALGGPFLVLGWYETLYGALLLPVYTFLVPLIKPEDPKA